MCCYEIPVSATDDLEISMFVADEETYNAEFNQLPNKGVSNFTLALNVTNVTDASFVLTFPQTQGLRMLEFSTMDDGIQNDALETPVVENLPNGRMRVTIDVEYPDSNYPAIREIYVDFTTQEVEDNDIPIWSSSAPDEGKIIPLSDDGTVVVVNGDITENWASDNHGWTLDCNFVEDGWSSQMDEDGAFIITSVGTGSSQATCNLVDPYGETSELSRTWTFGQLFTASAAMNATGDSIEFTITPTGLVNELEISAHAHQMNTMGQMRSVTLASDASTISLPLNGLSPGAIMVMGQAESSTMLTLDFMLDFDLEKASLPPLITVKKNLDGENATWEATGLTFTLQGDVLDPDGEEVSLSLRLCGYTTNNFFRVGSAWEVDVNIVSCSSQNHNLRHNPHCNRRFRYHCHHASAGSRPICKH